MRAGMLVGQRCIRRRFCGVSPCRIDRVSNRLKGKDQRSRRTNSPVSWSIGKSLLIASNSLSRQGMSGAEKRSSGNPRATPVEHPPRIIQQPLPTIPQYRYRQQTKSLGLPSHQWSCIPSALPPIYRAVMLHPSPFSATGSLSRNMPGPIIRTHLTMPSAREPATRQASHPLGLLGAPGWWNTMYAHPQEPRGMGR